MKVENFVEILGSDFYCGVPDSLLKPLNNYLMHTYGIDKQHHIIAANEGNAVAIAAGYHLATGKVPVVYLQNSGEGNIINPLASLLNDKVYAIPMIFIIGWRGEPGVEDEPQHIFQGKVTLKLLEDMDVATFVLRKDTTDTQLQQIIRQFQIILQQGKSIAFVVQKDALEYGKAVKYNNRYTISREEAIQLITQITAEDPIICTTGKSSRELFETRELNGENHEYDFLTVGSMGHSSSIALGIALHKTDKKIWCIDGDGAAIMHLGAFAVIGNCNPKNLVHIILNNEAHESVGGLPTVANTLNLTSVAKACNYPNAICVETLEEFYEQLLLAKQSKELYFIEVKCALGARNNLGRPTTSTFENKKHFMSYIASKSEFIE